jgi:hypothetical protein
LDFTWKTFTQDERTYLHLSADNIKLRQHLRPNKVSFWNTLIPMLAKSLPKPGGSENIPEGSEDREGSIGVKMDGHGGVEISPKTQLTTNSGPNVWIFIALSVGLATIVLILSICLLATSVQLKRYRRNSDLAVTFDPRSEILPRRV